MLVFGGAAVVMAGLLKVLPLEASHSASFALQIEHKSVFWNFSDVQGKQQMCQCVEQKCYLLSSAVSMVNLYWLRVLETGGLLTFLSVAEIFGFET